MKKIALSAALLASISSSVSAGPAATDRVYTADQNTNTVSVYDPSSNKLLGQIQLGNRRPDVLSAIYKGEINVHGLGYSPDYKTLLVVSNGSNSAIFIDTATNSIKGKTYLGRSPHEGFFTPDGKEAWVVVRGEDYISVIDPSTFKEKRRIQTAVGPGMVQFHQAGKLAFVVSSFTPELNVIDVKSYKVVKRIPVVSPFSPFLQFTPDHREVWMTHKDVGKVTRVDTSTLEIIGTFDTGFITNHISFAKIGGEVRAYITVGGENSVKVFSTGKEPKLLATIPTGALPHGVWTSTDSSRVYVGLENGDGVDVIDTSTNKVIANMAGGQAPQALVYLPGVATASEASNLVARKNDDPVNVSLRPVKGDGRGFIVVRNLGVLDSLEVSLFKLKPGTRYSIFLNDEKTPAASLMTDAKGAANGTVIGPVKSYTVSAQQASRQAQRIVIMEGTAAPSAQAAVLVDAT